MFRWAAGSQALIDQAAAPGWHHKQQIHFVTRHFAGKAQQAIMPRQPCAAYFPLRVDIRGVVANYRRVLGGAGSDEGIKTTRVQPVRNVVLDDTVLQEDVAPAHRVTVASRIQPELLPGMRRHDAAAVQRQHATARAWGQQAEALGAQSRPVR